VTVLEFLPRILPLNDTEAARILQRLLTRQGLTFHLDTRVTGASTQAGEVIVNAQHKGEGQIFKGDRVLVAVGRRPATANLGLEQVGVTIDEKSGRIAVDEHFQTTAAGIYAIGDIINGPMLAHKASEEGIAVAEHLAGKKSHVNYNTIPSVIYTAPELASVGLTEEQLKDSGREYRVGKFPFAASGRAKCLDETDGFVKVLADARTDRVLGVHILGPRASDMIAEAVLAMEYGASAEDIARTCHAHPTLSEAVGEAARGAWSAMIHG
jgi:dihydrolipoamide dehydrogenase